MRRVEEPATYYGASELRMSFDKILEEASKRKVIIEKRHKPVAVILSIEEFKKYEDAMEELEDQYLYKIAEERMKNLGKLIPLEEVKKRFKIK